MVQVMDAAASKLKDSKDILTKRWTIKAGEK